MEKNEQVRDFSKVDLTNMKRLVRLLLTRKKSHRTQNYYYYNVTHSPKTYIHAYAHYVFPEVHILLCKIIKKKKKTSERIRLY